MPGPVRRRVLFVIPTLHGGGAERVFTVLLKHLDRARFEPFLAVLRKDDPKNVYIKDVPHDVEVLSLGLRHARASPPALIRSVRRLRPGTVFSTLNYMNMAVIACRGWFPSSTRVVAREANNPSRSIAGAWFPGFYRFLYRRCYPRADAVICQTATVRDELVELAGPRLSPLIRIIPNPVDTEVLRARAVVAENPFRDSVGPNVLAAGRLTPQKGVDRLLKAFAELLRLSPHATLIVLGSGPDEAELKRLATTLGVASRVRFAGFVPDPAGYYRHAGVFATPSRWEGMPNTALEALACGAPVVTNPEAGDFRAILRQGVTGLVADANDPRAFAAALLAASALKPREGTCLLPARFAAPVITREFEAVLEGSDEGSGMPPSARS